MGMKRQCTETSPSDSWSRAKGNPLRRELELLIDDDELIIDCFAGGGGASVGIEMALGRSPDIAINHDAEAIAMHRANHPNTVHYIEDVFDVDPVIVCQGRRVGFAWFSPDCTEHSKAKNGSIVRDKKVRCLANVIHRWAATVRPRVFALENVEEFEDWGPLDDSGKIDKTRRGESFLFWWRRLEDMGYRLSMRILKACDYGAPTSRKRLFIIATCDETIDLDLAWPEATHGPGRELPYRTAAECIDYSLPCPSIFMTKDEARIFTKATGIRCKRPLADKTMQRIRRGIYKYVIGSARPFLVPTNHGGVGRNDQRVYDADEPMRTVTCAHRGEVGLVQPIVTSYYGESDDGGNDRARSASDPLPTQTCSNRFGVVAPFVTKFQQNSTGTRSDEPLHTAMAGATRFGLVAPTLVQTGYGEREGQAPRCLDMHAPLGTVIAGGGGNGNGKHALVAAFLEKGYSERDTGGWNGGQDLGKPMGAVTTRDHHHLVAGHMVKLRGTSDAHMDASSSPSTEPIPTVSANGNHVAEVRAFLSRYNGTGTGQQLTDPLLTVTTKDRFGLVMIDGEEYQIVDIGFRMLSPRELFRAQGFPDDYIIDPIGPDGAKLSGTAQVEKCGNSVSPPVACAIVRSVFSQEARVARVA